MTDGAIFPRPSCSSAATSSEHLFVRFHRPTSAGVLAEELAVVVSAAAAVDVAAGGSLDPSDPPHPHARTTRPTSSTRVDMRFIPFEKCRKYAQPLHFAP